MLDDRSVEPHPQLFSEEKCSHCSGSGKVYDYPREYECSDCFGTGRKLTELGSGIQQLIEGVMRAIRREEAEEEVRRLRY